MAKDKLFRFEAFRNFSNGFDFPFHMKGKWNAEYFKNDNPIVLELACGKGEYTVNLSEAFPEKNFIGIDKKSNRMFIGARMALAENRHNVAFVRLVIEKLEEIFAPGEVSEIWITFPDPFPKDRHEKHRLTHPRFLEIYRKVIKESGIMHLKTDDDGLFNYTESLFIEKKIPVEEIIRNVHGDGLRHPILQDITTHYERLFRAKGRTIKYMRFALPSYLPDLREV